MYFNAGVSNNPNNAGTQHGDQHPCEVLTASNLHSVLPHFACPCSTCMLLPLGLNSHICALSVHFCRLHLQGNVEMKDRPLPICILFLLAMGLHSGSSIWSHFVALTPMLPKQLHHTPFAFPTPTSWPKSPEVCVSPTGASHDSRTLNSRPALSSQFWGILP